MKAARRARSGPSGSASSAASATTGSPSTSIRTSATSSSSIRAACRASSRRRPPRSSGGLPSRRPRPLSSAQPAPSPPPSGPSSGHRSERSRPASSRLAPSRAAGPPDMPAGLFELRKDSITGWWVATIVDRAFHRDRFARAAEQIDDGGDCQNCRLPEGDGVRLRVLKDYAFHVVGTEEEARELDQRFAQVALDGARAAGSWRTMVAPPQEHRPLHLVGSAIIEALVTGARDAILAAREANQTEYLQVVQNWGGQSGARTN